MALNAVANSFYCLAILYVLTESVLFVLPFFLLQVNSIKFLSDLFCKTLLRYQTAQRKNSFVIEDKASLSG